VTSNLEGQGTTPNKIKIAKNAKYGPHPMVLRARTKKQEVSHISVANIETSRKVNTIVANINKFVINQFAKRVNKIANYNLLDEFALPRQVSTQSEADAVNRRRKFLRSLPPGKRNTLLTGDPFFKFDPIVYEYVWCWDRPPLDPEVLDAFNHLPGVPENRNQDRVIDAPVPMDHQPSTPELGAIPKQIRRPLDAARPPIINLPVRENPNPVLQPPTVHFLPNHNIFPQIPTHINIPLPNPQPVINQPQPIEFTQPQQIAFNQHQPIAFNQPQPIVSISLHKLILTNLSKLLLTNHNLSLLTNLNK